MKITEEQMMLAQKCASAEELVEKAKAEGLNLSLETAQNFLNSQATTELTPDDLDTIAGGCSDSYMKCKICGNRIEGLNYWAPDLNGTICQWCRSEYYTEDILGELHRRPGK